MPPHDSGEDRRRPGVLVVDDEPSLRFTLSEALRDEDFVPHEAADGAEAFRVLREHEIQLVLLDLKLQASGENGIEILKIIKRDYPEVEVIMMTAYGKFGDAVEATRAGCFQFIAKPFELEQIRMVLRGALENASLRREVEVLRRAQRTRFPVDVVIGESPSFRSVMGTVEKIAPSRATVLLLGETGSGKEVIARAIHRASRVAGGPLVEINCSAVPESLLESELFGHEKGAFTDAKSRKKGVFELADHGTLFLDEIGDMAQNLQAKLLRVLETGVFKRVGGTGDIQVQVRVIAATHRDLKQAVAEGRFREDLYFRLSVIPVVIPPLRERREDVLPLARFFLDHFNREMGTAIEGFTAEAEAILRGHPWPGNVRELRNVVERGVLLASSPLIDADALPPDLTSRASAPAGTPSLTDDAVWTLGELEKLGIERALSRFQGNKTRAADALGISRGTLRAKVKEYGLGADDEDDGGGAAG